MPHPGQWVTDNIELVTPIAQGAMGKVWVAYHHRLQVQVAVKFVQQGLGDDTAEAMARFEREASLASQINSPYVVRTYDSGISAAGDPYIVMELLEGKDLAGRLEQGPLTWQEANTILAQVSRALTKAHQLGIVHRDIKPGNVFLGSDVDGLLCKILDFGIAKHTRLPQLGGLTTDGKMVGTPEYMSPEMVFDGAAVDARADMWALAVCMYQAITGQLPFLGETVGQLCLNLVNTVPAKPSTLRGDVPASIDAWFAKALARESSERFESAREMALAFQSPSGDLADQTESATLLGLSAAAAQQPGLAMAKKAALRRRVKGVGFGLVSVCALTAMGWLALGSTPTVGVFKMRWAVATADGLPDPIEVAKMQPAKPEAAASSEPTARSIAAASKTAPAVVRRPKKPAAAAKPARPSPQKPKKANRRGIDELGF
jgi:eukaryotic-like serine/threonine-protein kinase